MKNKINNYRHSKLELVLYQYRDKPSKKSYILTLVFYEWIWTRW